jgi:uncharacterized membrane protein HdeD (DUF308 family)
MGLVFTAAIGMARMWWAFLLRGLLAIAAGIAVLLVPGIGLSALILLFAAWMIADGVAELIGAWRTRGQKNWWVGILEGIAGLVVGILALVLPGLTAVVLLYLVAAWAIVTGVLEIYAAIKLREEITGELWMGLAGLLSVLFGLYLILFPGAGILSLLWLVGVFAIAFGVFMLMLGWRLRGIHNRAKAQGEYAERGL